MLNGLLTGVLECFLEYISRASASITPVCRKTVPSLCDRGKSRIGKSFPSILLLSLEWNVWACAKTTSPIWLFCLCGPINGAHMAVSVFTRWLIALFSQWKKRCITFLAFFCAVGFRLNILQVSIMSCHIPARRMKDELAFGKPESTHWSLPCVISWSLCSGGLAGNKGRLVWLGWVFVVAVGWVCGRTSDSH